MSSPAWAGDRLAQFFGSQAALDEFEKTETVRQKIQLLWALPVTQVDTADTLEALQTVDTKHTVNVFAVDFVYHRDRYSFADTVDQVGVVKGVRWCIFETNYKFYLHLMGYKNTCEALYENLLNVFVIGLKNVWNTMGFAFDPTLIKKTIMVFSPH